MMMQSSRGGTNMALLEIRNLEVNYGPIQAVKGIDLDVEKGTIVTLLGANGAGKTSVMRAITGSVKKSGGTVLFGEKDITGLRACKIAGLGVNMSPEGRLVFGDLTVEENLDAGAYVLKSRTKHKDNLERVFHLFPILEERRKQMASTLSGGEQQMLAIGRALMPGPELLLLDEPSLGLAPLIIKQIFDTLKEIKSEGTTILMVEQNAKAALKIADYAYLLELGKISMQGPAEELLNNDKLSEAYLGKKNKK